MKVLLAEDDPVSSFLMEMTLKEWGHEVVVARDGLAAWEVLRQEQPPRLALLDWMMPGLEGPEICRKVREIPNPEPPYLILLTSRETKQDILVGLESGADDYVVKSADLQELHARFRVAERMVDLQKTLADRVRALEDALAQVKHLQGLLPICSYCKKVRDDNNYWQQVDAYVTTHSEVRFSHGICPDCWEKEVRPQFRKEGIPLPDDLF